MLIIVNAAIAMHANGNMINAAIAEYNFLLHL